MKRFYRDDGVEISREDVQVSDFLQKNPKYDFLKIYHLEEKITIEEDKIFISNEVIPDFSPAQLTKLKLPPRYPHLFRCKASGAILQDDYKITPIFKTKSGRPLGDYKQLKGTFISFRDKKYTLPHEIYEALQLIEKINSTTDYGRKLTLVQKLKILEIKVSNHSLLEDINVSTASHFSLTVKDQDNFTVLPVFLKEVSNGEAGNTDTETEEVGEPESEQENAVQDLLPQEQIKKYHEYFQSHARVASQTQVADNKFLVLDDKLKKIMQVIKEAHKTKSVAARRALYACPNTYLRKEMGQEFSDDLVDTFIPDARYVSERISHIGEWTPKAQAFLPSSHNTWIPQDLAGIRLDNELIYLNPKRIPAAVEKMQQALRAQQKTVKIDGQETQVTPENIDLLTQASVNYEKNASSFQQVKRDTSQDTLNPRLTAIVKDNIDDDRYQEGVISRKPRIKLIPIKLITTPYEYQREGIKWLQEAWNSGRRGVLLADDMGLGKTLQVLVFLAWLRETADETKPFFIVGPVAVLKNWQDEHNTHLHAPGLGEIVLGHGEDLARIKQKNRTSQGIMDYFAKADCVLTTYDSLARNEDIFRGVAWQAIVFDECQYIKNPAAYRTDMAKAMAAEFSIAVTGTPVENSLIDLWCIADAVSPGVLDTCKNFKSSYVNKKNGGTKSLHRKLTKKIIPPFLLRRTKEQHLDSLPKKDEIIMRRAMSAWQEDAYSMVIAGIQKGKPDSMVQVLQAIRRMRDISLCPLVGYEANNDKDFIASSARLSLLFETLDKIKASKEKALIFLEKRQMQGKLSAVIQRRYTLAASPPIINGAIVAEKRKKIVDDFQKLPHGFAVLIISPKAGGVGLTITNANNVIHLSRWWNPAVEDQCSDRVYRIGQKRDVNIYILIATHPHPRVKSHDEVLHEMLSAKRQLSREIITPTAFGLSDYEDILKQTTGYQYKDFYQSDAWIKLREETLARYGKKCQKCGATPPAAIEIDHIKPRSRYPKLALDPNNLQVLCQPCNQKKSDKDETDYRDDDLRHAA